MITLTNIGVCPKCRRELSNLMMNAYGYCEVHGYVPADWGTPRAEDDEMDALLEGRFARCACGAERPSAGDGRGSLAFFEYLGPGSRESQVRCLHCGYFDVAHDSDHMETLVHDRDGNRRPTVVEAGKCPGFEAHGPFEHDRFYCGCRGWD